MSLPTAGNTAAKEEIIPKSVQEFLFNFWFHGIPIQDVLAIPEVKKMMDHCLADCSMDKDDSCGSKCLACNLAGTCNQESGIRIW